MIGSKVTAMKRDGSPMEGFCLVVDFPGGGSATDAATPTSFSRPVLLLYIYYFITSLGILFILQLQLNVSLCAEII